MAAALKVLMIEDSEDDALLIARELRAGGYAVDYTRVETPAAIESAIREQQWDLVISDYSMPYLTGTNALKLVRSMGSEAPFLFVSGTMGEETAVAALKEGAQDYLMKTNLKRLVPAVQRELRDAEERRERKRLELHVQQLQRFESIGRLAGGIAHDFNNVIGAILAWAEMGLAEAQLQTRQHDRFQKIRDQTLWAGKLTSQLLAFARRQVLQPRKVNLNSLVEGSMSLLRRVIGEQIAIRVVAAPELSVTLADPTQIEQVIMNLCLNARDAMPDGGQLIIETRNADIGEDYCRSHAYARAGSYVSLSVSDTGVGIDAATIERIFEPFFTTKEMGRGTGLGLATVYGIVKQHGGFIYVYSELGVGTTFRLYLPSATGVHEPREGQPEEQIRRGTETILLADDHAGLRESAKEMLEGLGYQVILATNGIEAVELFRKDCGHTRLAILDVVMPLLSGPDAYSQIAAIRPDIKVIFTSGYSGEASSMKFALDRDAPLLQKPYSLKTLSQMVRSALDGDGSV